jgi:hypothetical protein
MTLEEFSTVDGATEVVHPDVPDQKIAFIDTEGQGDQGEAYEYVLHVRCLILC